jgi:osomolarity two-component system sensor histidine kinase SLN1
MELAARRMWTLRSQLKTQFKEKQRAQIEERKANDSKRRFTSYILHELRGPANSALLAVQNLEANGGNRLEDCELEYSTLKSSFQMMSQVLDDVLDFTRMERGGFSTVSRPFNFGEVMKSIFLPLQLTADSKNLTLSTLLDERIGEAAEILLGDEIRIRQVVNNLTSNALKFTPPTGTVSINCSLIYVTPLPPAPPTKSNSSSEDTAVASPASPRIEASKHDRFRRVVVVRIEVTDTGVGIKRKDLEDNRLFSAYVQTEIGRTQGGKGTGLGLSLVRQIVLLSGGRLGCKSTFNQGSTFWVELAFPIFQTPGPISSIESSSSGGGSETLYLPTLSSQPKTELIGEAFASRSRAPGHNLTPPLKQHRSGGSIPIRPPPMTEVSSTSYFHTPSLVSSLPLSFAPISTSITAPSSLAVDSSPLEITTLSPPPLSVLIVDDDSLTRRLMARMMTRLGCVTQMAENGAVGLEMILRQKEGEGEPRYNYGLILLDNQMPAMSGLEVAAALRERGRDDVRYSLYSMLSCFVSALPSEVD